MKHETSVQGKSGYFLGLKSKQNHAHPCRKPLPFPSKKKHQKLNSLACGSKQLGVGSIGTLLAFHLRQQLPASTRVALLLRARGIPRVDRDSRRVDRQAQGKESGEADGGPVLSVEKGGIRRKVSGFEAEIVGPAIDNALSALSRARSFPGPEGSRKTLLAAANLSTPSTPTTPIQSLIVTLKTHQTLLAIRQLAPRLRPESCITLLQNGMGIYDALCDEVWPDPQTRPQFVLGSTTHGAGGVRTPRPLKAKRGGGWEFERSVVHTGTGDVLFGVVPDPRGQVDYDARLFPSSSTPASNPLPSLSATPNTDPTPLEHTLAALLSLEPLNTSLIPMPKMYHHLLLKLSTNCAVNPLTALLGVQNGALIGPSQTQSIMRAVLREASEAITRYLASVRDDNEPLDPETVAMFSPSALERRTMAVLAATARNTSSMASDVSRLSRGGTDVGTEIEYINGFLVRLGERMGLEMPVNRMLREMVGAKEEIARMSPGLLLPVKR